MGERIPPGNCRSAGSSRDARPAKLFTAHSSLVAGQVGELQSAKFTGIREAVVRLIQKD